MLKTIVKFARIRILVSCYALVFIGSVAAGGITPRTILAIFVLLAWYVHAALINDYADREIDAINHKHLGDRPFVRQTISRRQFWIIHGVSAAMALALSLFYGMFAVIATIAMLLTDYLYSMKPFRITDRGLYSQLVLCVGYVFYPFSLGYWAIDMPNRYEWLLAGGLYFGFVARVLLKDFRDVKGDKVHGKLTFLLRHGAGVTCAVSGICWVVSLAMLSAAVSYEVGVVVPLILSLVFGLWLLCRLAMITSIQLQQDHIKLIAKIANVCIIVILTMLLCRAHYAPTARENTVLPLMIGIVLLIPVALRMRVVSAVAKPVS